jgi:hypothetical protein
MQTVYSLTPKTKKCLEWIKENVYSESWQWLGKSLVVEHRFIGYLYGGLIEAKFKPNKDFNIA